MPRSLAPPLPGPLPNELSTGVPVLPDGQVILQRGHDGQVQALDHMPTPPDHLTTGGRPPGLTRYACPTSFKNSQRGRIPGTCPLCTCCRMVRGGAKGIASPYRNWCSPGAIPFDLPDGAGAIAQGPREPAGASRSRVRRSALPLPPSRLDSLWVALWEGSRCSAYGATRPAGNRRPGGGQVRRRIPPAMVDVQPCTAGGMVAKIDQRPTG